ncbi:ParA family protein [Amantichitinum ursilacus]|uniref:Sporulation initiation inhibitor protein Soj n=1 Tax=Amantichitinum ursilacus TaxID=857265 RepID=A0A0N0XHU8_9NEIS|nr:AAA family ATPase [Amantichitinum ursilacus]KPC52188.1 Sporulation initiation inhibitor protein Soj [Amantichitinum ursilacus]
MTRVLAIANQKGGVGKTTTAVNLAASLVHLGKRVMLIDLDPQANATMGAGIDKSKVKATVYSLLIGESSVHEVMVASETGGFDLLPATRDLAGAEVELVEAQARESRLKQALAPVVSNYDFVIIDCPPALNLLTLNGLVAADAVLIPMQCEYYALEGLSDLVSTLRRIRQSLNRRIEIEGLLRTMFDPRSTLAQQVSDQLVKHFTSKLYHTVIPRNVRLAEAPSYGRPILAYDKTSKGAQAYLQLAEELLARHNTHEVAHTV